MNQKNLIMTGVIALAVGAVAFFGGMQYQKTKFGNNFGPGMMQFRNGNGNAIRANGQRNGNQMMGGVRPVTGEVTSVDKNTVTVKTPDGGSKIIVFSDSTKVNKTTDGTKSDIKTGETITAFGTENNGSVTAETISVGTLGGFRMMFGQQQPTPTK